MSRTLSIDSGPSNYAQKVSVGGHVLPADEPAHSGGRDTGPNPQEYLMAALGACASITAQMYAERKQWNLQTVHIDVAHERVLAADNAASGATIGMVDQFEMQICLAGDLSEDQRNRLLEIANRCPIHRMLTSGVKIHSRLSAKAAQAGKSPEVSQETLVGGIE
jgi:putative redox protein